MSIVGILDHGNQFCSDNIGEDSGEGCYFFWKQKINGEKLQELSESLQIDRKDGFGLKGGKRREILSQFSLELLRNMKDRMDAWSGKDTPLGTRDVELMNPLIHMLEMFSVTEITDDDLGNGMSSLKSLNKRLKSEEENEGNDGFIAALNPLKGRFSELTTSLEKQKHVILGFHDDLFIKGLVCTGELMEGHDWTSWDDMRKWPEVFAQRMDFIKKNGGTVKFNFQRTNHLEAELFSPIQAMFLENFCEDGSLPRDADSVREKSKKFFAAMRKHYSTSELTKEELKCRVEAERKDIKFHTRGIECLVKEIEASVAGIASGSVLEIFYQNMKKVVKCVESLVEYKEARIADLEAEVKTGNLRGEAPGEFTMFELCYMLNNPDAPKFEMKTSPKIEKDFRENAPEGILELFRARTEPVWPASESARAEENSDDSGGEALPDGEQTSRKGVSGEGIISLPEEAEFQVA